VARIVYPSIEETQIGHATILENFERLNDILKRRENEENFGTKFVVLKLLVDYMRSPLILDDFDNNETARNSWESGLMGNSEEKNRLLKMNKLKGGNIVAIFLGIQYLTAENKNIFSDTVKQQYDTLYKEYKGENENDPVYIKYNYMTQDSKIEFIKRFTPFVKEVYKTLATNLVDASTR
jgi:hypothetical protein